MKIRNGFVSNSSSSSFIVHINKPIERTTYEEFKSYLDLNLINTKYPYCENIEKGIEQLYEAVLNSTQTDIEKFKCDYTYEVELGDLCDMEQVEEAYNLMQDFPSNWVNHDCIKIATNDIVIIEIF